MAARMLLFLDAVAFVLLATLLLVKSETPANLCPKDCFCLGSIVDCSERKLTEIPEDLPNWVTRLDLQSNQLTYIPDNAFQGLDLLESLDLSTNELTTFNATVFSHLPQLKTLRASYNKLTEIPDLGRNTHMTHLVLHHNDISSIQMEILDNLPALRQLDLNYNSLRELRAGTFPRHPSLHQLFLNNNKINLLQDQALHNLTQLEWLKLNKNRITRLPKDAFSHLKNLKYLELNRNRFRTIEGLVFQELENLTVLKLRRNQISELMDGAFYAAVSNIQTLELDHNNISAVTQGWLYGLKKLQQLSLSHNHISMIKPDAWDDCEVLHDVDLSHNGLTRIREDMFQHLGSLRALYLNYNKIEYISEQAFTSLHSLHILEMNHNQISWTTQDMNGAFEGLESLTRLGLSSNNIRSIAKRAFYGLEKLHQLHLTDNAISSIQSNAFEPLVALQELKLNTSNMICDCQLSWLPGWLKDAGFSSMISVTCAHPERLKGKSVFDIEHEEFKCDDFPKPLIITEPQTQNVLRGTNVTLKCVATSSNDAPMTSMWKKEDEMVPSSDVENYESNNGRVTMYTTLLHLRRVSDEAEGQYRCVITNTLGSATSKKAVITVHVFPAFTKTPENVTIRAGKTARLVCRATGHPPPEIAWQKDGGHDFPAARERRMHVMNSDDVFLIVKVKSVDQGIYSCTAKNDAGTIVANASLTVLETPAFVRAMVDKKVREGETSVLECMSSGSPRPKLEWMKDEEPLFITDRHFLAANDQLLIIVQTRPTDAGRYQCIMSNTLGTERGYSQLSVVAPGHIEGDITVGFDDESTTTGIIIIAVVCCVVGTSLVWVIIIYQTRKKSEEYSSTPTDETTLPGEMPGTPYRDGSSSGVLPHHIIQYAKYPSLDVNGRESPRTFGMSNKTRITAIFPSDADDDDHRQSIPLTSDEQQPAEASDNSISALHRLQAASDSDTIHSSSPSTRSTRSSHSMGGVMQTFHPNAATAGHNDTQGLHDPDSPIGNTPAVAVVHALPGNNGSQPRFVHIVDHRIPDGHHGSRPPEQYHDQGCCGCVEGQRTNANPSSPHSHLSHPSLAKDSMPCSISERDGGQSRPCSHHDPPAHHSSTHHLHNTSPHSSSHHLNMSHHTNHPHDHHSLPENHQQLSSHHPSQTHHHQQPSSVSSSHVQLHHHPQHPETADISQPTHSHQLNHQHHHQSDVIESSAAGAAAVIPNPHHQGASQTLPAGPQQNEHLGGPPPLPHRTLASPGV